MEDQSHTLQKYADILRKLHGLHMREHRTYEALCQDYLDVGCEVFGLSTGIVSHVEGELYTVEAVVSPFAELAPGMTFSLPDTYCARVLSENHTVALENVGAMPDMRGHPVYQNLKLESYLGTPVQVLGEIYGTLNFSSTEVRAAPFQQYEFEILELMAESMGSFIALRQARDEQAQLRQEQALREARQQGVLERSERLATLGLLAAGVAHEINNPLQGMQSHLNAVRRALPPDFEQVSSLDMVGKGITSIAGIVRQLLILQSPAGPALRHCNVAEVVDFVSMLLMPEFKKLNIRIVSEVESLPNQAAISQQELTQILLNLFLNARDAMPMGGEIRIEAEQNATETHLSVSDTGIGFDPAKAEEIFSPFFTTKGTRGTGLGLTMAESVVRNVAGRIAATSIPGQGSTFHVHLPNQSEDRLSEPAGM